MSIKEATETIRADDFVEYFLFPNIHKENEDDEMVFMEQFLCEINKAVKTFIDDYIWQKDSFQLIIQTKLSQIVKENDIDGKNNSMFLLLFCLKKKTFFFGLNRNSSAPFSWNNVLR